MRTRMCLKYRREFGASANKASALPLAATIWRHPPDHPAPAGMRPHRTSAPANTQQTPTQALNIHVFRIFLFHYGAWIAFSKLTNFEEARGREGSATAFRDSNEIASSNPKAVHYEASSTFRPIGDRFDPVFCAHG